jgi:hypothetical protein
MYPDLSVTRKKTEEYQCDAISALVQLNESHFQRFHTFRLDWQPGPDGHIRWYSDEVFRFGMTAEGLSEEKAQIPNEPSYVIFNTAISTSWGFPNPPWGCTDYDCKNTGSQCGFNPGFCKTLPAKFMIDHVRIYQNKADPLHTVGCNPPDYPTRRYIEAHAFRYKTVDDVDVLKPIIRGGSKCHSSDQCGEGQCVNGYCECSTGWVGPKCLVSFFLLGLITFPPFHAC